MPLALTVKQRSERDSRYIWVLGRLKPDTSVKQAAAEMSGLAQREAATYPDSSKGWQLRVLPVREFASSDLTRQYTLLLMGAVGFVLLIACADVANVQFARVSAVRRNWRCERPWGKPRAHRVPTAHGEYSAGTAGFRRRIALRAVGHHADPGAHARRRGQVRSGMEDHQPRYKRVPLYAGDRVVQRNSCRNCAGLADVAHQCQ